MTTPAARWHLLTAVVATAALVLQAVLVVEGSAVLAEHDPPGLTLRLLRLVGYFTIQSNLLVCVVAWQLARNPLRDGRWWRVARLDAVAAITVTGLVHWVALRPLLDLHGPSWAADKLLHVVVPVLAVAGWAALGPRPRVDARTIRWAVGWPVVWLVVTLVVGGLTGWYPYPFLDAGRHGYPGVLGAATVVTALMLALFAVIGLLDRRLAPTAATPATPLTDQS